MTETRKQPPVTANRVERSGTKRKRRLPIALLLVPVVVVVAIAVLILVLSGGNSGGILGGIGGHDDEIPAFEFKAKRVGVEATTENADLDAMRVTAGQIQTEIVPELNALFTEAFLDPENWRNGEYDEVLEPFADDALPHVQEGLETLTLGANAGDVYDEVTPTKGSVATKVLFDLDGNPNTVNVTFRFYALGERKDGTYTAIVSHGQLTMQDLDGWKIIAFDVSRADHETEPPAPAPSGSASTTPSA